MTVTILVSPIFMVVNTPGFKAKELVHFEDGVNLTMGLPLIRTSVDHGTAYDIAGTGKASDASLRAACAMAARIVTARQKNLAPGE